MKNYTVVISRQHGSGGKTIAHALAQRLGIPCYDREILQMACDRLGIDIRQVCSPDEMFTTSFLYNISKEPVYTKDGRSIAYDRPMEVCIQEEQAEVVRHLAETQSCVIVGKAADYVLRNRTNCLKIYISAPIEARALREKRRGEEISEEKMEKRLRKLDKRRAKFYETYTGRKWGVAENYDLTMDSYLLGIEGTTSLLHEYVQRWRRTRGLLE